MRPGCRTRWLEASQVAAFAAAAIGAACALYYLLPSLQADPYVRGAVAKFAIILIGAFLMLVLFSRLKRRR